MKTFALFVVAAALASGVSGCASKPVQRPAAAENPAAGEAFAAFTRVELRPVALSGAAAAQKANLAAAQKIQDALAFYMAGPVAGWNAEGAARGGAVRTLVISPVVEEINFVTKKARFWSGRMKGASEVLLRVTCEEAESGRRVASAEFYASTDARRGAETYGGSDDAMLARVANMLADYLLKNHDAPGVTPTGG
jgi:hypothetical protein